MITYDPEPLNDISKGKPAFGHSSVAITPMLYLVTDLFFINLPDKETRNESEGYYS
jgi:hypothetical protein